MLIIRYAIFCEIYQLKTSDCFSATSIDSSGCKLGQSHIVYSSFYDIFFQTIFEPPEIHFPFIVVAFKVETGRFFEMS